MLGFFKKPDKVHRCSLFTGHAHFSEQWCSGLEDEGKHYKTFYHGEEYAAYAFFK